MQIRNQNKKVSVFYSLIVFFIMIGLTGFYINNVVLFNSLMKKNKELKEKSVQIKSENSKKKMEIESLTSFVRIKTLVNEKFGMIYNENAIDKREILINLKDAEKR